MNPSNGVIDVANLSSKIYEFKNDVNLKILNPISLLGLSLVSDCLHPLLESLLVQQVVVLEWLELLIELIHKRACSGYVILDDLLVTHAT